jgi:hypothetical protein
MINISKEFCWKVCEDSHEFIPIKHHLKTGLYMERQINIKSNNWWYLQYLKISSIHLMHASIELKISSNNYWYLQFWIIALINSSAELMHALIEFMCASIDLLCASNELMRALNQ